MHLNIENELNKLNIYGSKLGLERIRELLNRLGNPHKDLRVIHVGGTNGKGSTIAYLESIAIKAGIKCGAYTSPALECFNENVRINKERLNNIWHMELCKSVIKECENMIANQLEHPTRFEVETAIALCHFANENCDIVFLEVGLGGKDDATCIIENPILTILTSISIDHMEEFGDTIEEIALAECGIIKEGVPVIVAGNQTKEVLEIIKEVSSKKNAPITVADIYDKSLKNIAVYAPVNAGLAKATTKHLGYNKKAIESGIAKTKWYGRYTNITNEYKKLKNIPTIILDGAHNVVAINLLCDTLKKEYPNKKITFIVSINSDKQADKMLELLAGIANRIICLGNKNSTRLLAAEELANIAKKYHDSVEIACSPFFAIINAIENSKPNDIIVTTGSLSHLNFIENAYDDYILWHEDLAVIKELTDNGRNKRILKIFENDEFFLALDSIKDLEKSREFCKHNLEHCLQVARLALKESNGKINVEIIIVTALLHDLGRAKEWLLNYNALLTNESHNILSAKYSEKILLDCGFSIDETNLIYIAIENHNNDKVALETGLNGIIYRADKTSRDCENCKTKNKCKNHL